MHQPPVQGRRVKRPFSGTSQLQSNLEEQSQYGCNLFSVVPKLSISVHEVRISLNLTIISDIFSPVGSSFAHDGVRSVGAFDQSMGRR